MSLVSELEAAAERNPHHWMARVVRNRPSMTWRVMLAELLESRRSIARWDDDGGSAAPTGTNPHTRGPIGEDGR